MATGGGWQKTTYPKEYVSARIKAGGEYSRLGGLTAVDQNAAGEARNGALHHLGVLLITGQCVHYDEINR